MKKNIPLKIFYFLVAAVAVFNVISNIYESVYFNIEKLPTGSLVYSCKSPDDKRTLNIYRVENSLGSAIRGEIVMDEKSNNVFWQTNLDDVSASWIDKNLIKIDDLVLDVAHNGNYDCRRGKSLFQEGAVEKTYVSDGERTE